MHVEVVEKRKHSKSFHNTKISGLRHKIHVPNGALGDWLRKEAPAEHCHRFVRFPSPDVCCSSCSLAYVPSSSRLESMALSILVGGGNIVRNLLRYLDQYLVGSGAVLLPTLCGGAFANGPFLIPRLHPRFALVDYKLGATSSPWKDICFR